VRVVRSRIDGRAVPYDANGRAWPIYPAVAGVTPHKYRATVSGVTLAAPLCCAGGGFRYNTVDSVDAVFDMDAYDLGTGPSLSVLEWRTAIAPAWSWQSPCVLPTFSGSGTLYANAIFCCDDERWVFWIDGDTAGANWPLVFMGGGTAGDRCLPLTMANQFTSYDVGCGQDIQVCLTDSSPRHYDVVGYGGSVTLERLC
jgi:hypothetical protein